MFRDASVYFFIALIGYGIDVSIYLLLLALHMDVYTSYIIALAIGLSCNVVLLRWFFKKGRYGFLKDIWLTYVANGFVLLFGFGFYSGLIAILGIAPLFAKLISNSLTFIINFAIRIKLF